MKTFNRTAIAIILIAIAFSSCKKSKKQAPVGALGPDYPYILNSIISPAIIDSLKKDGMKINDGLTPPTVNGIYLFSPDYCTFDNSTDQSAGSVYDDYDFKFANQNNTTYNVYLAYKDVSNQGTDSGSANNATIISGGGNLFTLYAQARDTTQGVTSVILQIVSGEFAAGGIKNMQNAIYIKSKGADPNNVVAPVGTIRIFEDQDGNSETQSSFGFVQRTASGAPIHLKTILSSALRKGN